jgi:hypothetical protein
VPGELLLVMRDEEDRRVGRREQHPLVVEAVSGLQDGFQDGIGLLLQVGRQKPGDVLGGEPGSLGLAVDTHHRHSRPAQRSGHAQTVGAHVKYEGCWWLVLCDGKGLFPDQASIPYIKLSAQKILA